MSLLVLAYPQISGRDFEFIQAIRARENRLYYSVVDPHFTIVFPVNTVNLAEFVKHVQERACSVPRFSFVLRCAILDKDAFNQFTHVFLVPDEGYSRLVKLHDLLYTGILAAELRLDLPFIPHIGVANAVDARHCKRVAESLNQEQMEIQGTIAELTIVRYEQDKVTPLERISLL